ncbi:Flagellar hook-length control protein FliK [Minicystis rosea]|nr:Flagellar hook-length control protein FliK [Minicystis rosea]
MVLACLHAGEPAHAADPPRVVLVAAETEHAFMERLRAELTALGFEVITAPAPPGALSREALEASARAASAVAAMRVAWLRAGLEVWVVDRVTGKTVLREVMAAGAAPESTVALRAVELLRASLMELDAAQPPRGETPAPEGLRAAAGLPPPPSAPPNAAHTPTAPVPPTAPTRPFLSIDVGASITGSPGGLPAFPALTVGLSGWIVPQLSAGLLALVPLSTAHDQGPEGTSSSRITLFGVEARFEPLPAARFRPSIGAGAALVWMHTDGTGGSARYAGASPSAWSGGPFVRPGLGIAVASHLVIRADLLAGVALRRLVIAYAGRDAAAWGVPFLSGSLGLEVSVP